MKKENAFCAICHRYGSEQTDEILIFNCKNVIKAEQVAFDYFLLNSNELTVKRIKKIEILQKGKATYDKIQSKPIYTKNY